MAAGEESLIVGVAMGSDSDLETMRHVGRALRDTGFVPKLDYEMRVVSAHRDPHGMTKYADEAEDRGLEAIIGGAGGSAHLPGMLASETTIPLVGVAVTSHPEVMNMALGSQIGLPEGKPLATFQAAHGAYNAGRFAAQMVTQAHRKASRVAIVMGSDSEHAIMFGAGKALSELGVGETDYEEVVLESESQIDSYTPKLDRRNLAAIIVSSNGRHNLAREMSQRVSVPILGVAITENKDVMSDGLYAMVNSPEGRPIAAFQDKAGAFNAGLHAARIIALHNPALRQAIKHYDAGLVKGVGAKDYVLRDLSDEAYYNLKPEERQKMIAAASVRGELFIR